MSRDYMIQTVRIQDERYDFRGTCALVWQRWFKRASATGDAARMARWNLKTTRVLRISRPCREFIYSTWWWCAHCQVWLYARVGTAAISLAALHLFLRTVDLRFFTRRPTPRALFVIRVQQLLRKYANAHFLAHLSPAIHLTLRIYQFNKVQFRDIVKFNAISYIFLSLYYYYFYFIIIIRYITSIEYNSLRPSFILYITYHLIIIIYIPLIYLIKYNSLCFFYDLWIVATL